MNKHLLCTTTFLLFVLGSKAVDSLNHTVDAKTLVEINKILTFLEKINQELKQYSNTIAELERKIDKTEEKQNMLQHLKVRVVELNSYCTSMFKSTYF